MVEIQGWFEYFRRRPIGWRDDHRFSMLLSFLTQVTGQKNKANPTEMFSSLKAMERERLNYDRNEPKSHAEKLVSSGFLNKLVNSGKGSGWNPKVKV